jgi:predicted nucleic acid-binding protein
MMIRSSLFVDTSGWAAAIDRGDTFYQQAQQIVHRAYQQKRPLITSNYILSELAPLLERRNVARTTLLLAIRTIRADPRVSVIHIDQAIDNEAWALLDARLDKQWSLVDASSFILIRRMGIIEALTNDHHFEQAGLSRLLL